MGNEFWAAIAGAVIGSLTGGIIAYAIQHKALLAASNERAREANARLRAFGFSLFVKFIKIQSHFHHLHDHLDAAYTKKPESRTLAICLAFSQ
jgi:membrane protein YqaA with SNARE-associated domain